MATDHVNSAHGPASEPATVGVFDALARLPAQALVDERGLAQALGISARTVPRWVRRGDLPAGTKLGGKTVWMAGKILEHIAEKMEQSSKSANRRMAAQGHAKEGLSPCFGANTRPHVTASR